VVFFDKENMPEEGTKITVGDFTATFKKVSDELEIVQDEIKYEGLPVSNDILLYSWQCKKCALVQDAHPINEAGTEILRCEKCGFRTLKNNE
jgi:predicted Zn-ribbon and HTH transcriptional regulator